MDCNRPAAGNGDSSGIALFRPLYGIKLVKWARCARAEVFNVMCLAIPGKIVDLLAGDHPLALVDVLGVRRKVDLGLLDADDPGRVGDWVLIHVGFAMNKISEERAREQIGLLEMLGESQTAETEVRGYGMHDDS
jgi:hydrogenase expression/formation protein HypC